MAKVYVSSTVKDLEAERKAVLDWLVAAGHQPVHSYRPDSETVRESCLVDIDGCDLYVLILGHRYGFQPADGNPDKLSITQLEYRRAKGRPRIALLRTSIPDIALSDIADPERFGRLQAFRQEVQREVRPAEFNDLKGLIQGLSTGVQRALQKLQQERPAGKQPTRPVPSPILRLPQHAIVGRDKLIDRVRRGLEAGERDFAFVYLPGVGKTAVASELIRNQAIPGRFVDGVLWAHLGQDPDVSRQLTRWGKSLGLSKDELDDCANLGELEETVAAAIGDGRMLLVIDDVWTTEAGEHFLIGGPNCARVITTRYQNVARELMPTVDAVLEVPKLNEEEGLRLLAELAPHAAEHTPAALRKIVARVDGLPIALVLMGRMIKRDGDDPQAAQRALQTLSDIRQVFGEKKNLEFAEAHHFSLGEVIEASYGALGAAGPLNRGRLPGEQLRQAVAALSILRPDPAWFSVELAGIVTGTSEATLKALTDAGLIEAIRYNVDLKDGSGETRYAMHRMIAEYLRTKLPPPRLQALNRLAADYYLSQLKNLEEAFQETDATSYSFMYRFEDAEWQDCQDNWLYYFAQTGYDAEANLAFLHVWFDGFWWWSCFTAEGYDFCDELLDDWDHRLNLTASGEGASPSLAPDRVERLMQGLELLRRFKRAYPKETEDRSGGSWPEVGASLNEIRRRTFLDGDLAALTNPHARHVRALTDILLAETERFGHKDVEAAEPYYREALAVFRDAQEDWNIAWSLYHLADMLSTCGRAREARELALEARDYGHKGPDYEVLALVHRVLGDVALSAQEEDQAGRNYQLAVEFAYRFQVEPTDPDPYTIRFYAKLALTVAGRLQERSAAQPEQARRIAQALRRAWLDCDATLTPVAESGIDLNGTKAEILAEQLFPPSLALERLRIEEDAYEASVKANLAALARRNAAPSDTN